MELNYIAFILNISIFIAITMISLLIFFIVKKIVKFNTINFELDSRIERLEVLLNEDKKRSYPLLFDRYSPLFAIRDDIVEDKIIIEVKNRDNPSMKKDLENEIAKVTIADKEILDVINDIEEILLYTNDTLFQKIINFKKSYNINNIIIEKLFIYKKNTN